MKSMKVRKIETRYLRSDFLIELIVSILAGLSAIIWTAIFTSETTILDVRTTLRSKYLQSRIDEAKKDEALDRRLAVITIPENVMVRYERSGDNRTTPRDYLAKLVETVAYYKPKVIALDYVFDHPAKPAEDKALIDAIRKAGNVIIGYEQLPTIHGYSTVITDTLRDFMEAASGAAYLNMVRDKDGLIRAYEFARDGDASFAHRIVAGYHALPHKTYNKNDDNHDQFMNVPVAARDFFRQRGIGGIYTEKSFLNYRLPLKQTFVIYDNSDDILKPFPNPVIAEKLRDRIVIIGDGTYKSDLHKTPFSDNDRADSPADTPGVLIQATAVQNLLNADLMTQIPGWLQFLIVVATGLIAFLISYWLRFLPAVYLTFAAIGLHWFVVFFAYLLWSVWIPVVSPTIVMFSVSLMTLVFRIALSEKDNLDAEDLLGPNVPQQVLERVEAQQYESLFESRAEDLVLLMIFPRHLPQATDGIAARRSAEFTNYYYETMRRVVFAADAAFNSLPDGVCLAFWNAPLKDEQAFAKAMSAVQEITDHLALINQKGRHMLPDFAGIAVSTVLHYGRATAGYLGATGDRRYSVYGKAVDEALALRPRFMNGEIFGHFATGAFKEGSSHQTGLSEQESSHEGLLLYKLKAYDTAV